jgi:hypothetical protein
VCEYVESDELEEVEVVAIPDDVRSEYTTTEMRPKVVRVCPKLFTE